MANFRHNNGDNISDDENTPLTQDIYGESQRTVPETKGWDVFQDPPIKEETGSMANQACMEQTIRILKALAYLLTFVIVLGSGVISKGTLLFMTSQINPKHTLSYCNQEYGRDKQFTVQLPTEERVAWMWCILFAFCVPELGAFIRSIRICYFKTWKVPPFSHFLIVFLAETAHSVGMSLLVYSVLPDLDVIKGAMISNCVCFLPGVLGLLSRSEQDPKRFIKVVIDVMAIAAQVTGFVVWPLLEGRDTPSLWVTPLSIFLISCGWWENYVHRHSPLPFIRVLADMKNELNLTRYFMYSFISIWKIIVFFIATIITIQLREGEVSHFFSEFGNAFSAHNITLTEIEPHLGGSSLPDITDIIRTGVEYNYLASEMTPIHVFLINIFATYFVYIFGKFACKIMIQGFSYAFPINLTIPVSISLLITFCGLRNGDPCYFHDTFPSYLFFECPKLYFLDDFISEQHAWIWLLWLLSQTWITLHIWTPKCARLSSTEKLFVSPMYNAFLIDQSMGLNRRMDDQADGKPEDLDEIQKEKSDDTSSNVTSGSSPKSPVKSSDYTTRIYICATMWHEEKSEMLEFLKSVMRMDEDQCARRVAQKYLMKVEDPDYYELETHIFFDDAFEVSDHSADDHQINTYVKTLVAHIDEAASEVHKTNIHIRPPRKYPAPYGGRIEWVLPGKTKMIAHLKDKSKVRHKKRWSQVMYMYYLLGHRLMELPISVDRKEVIAENTYLLALDGDIDFQPHAVQLLVDLMKKNRNLGAACGRIHPVGAGAMVWYQMFEYAIGHWLQKATEHMIGCVLCSPGCFSLFRGKALMEDNVMRKYTTQSKEARHFVQYDQGEDRWLCTLILQRGYRIEYSAASDAYTHCPEGFNEFYNQRRRWVPSTIANIMDLLQDSKRTVKNNSSISMSYIAYQILLMGGTILGPGTIFLMLVGAFVAAFQIDNWTSFYYNLIPILIFMFVCFTCKSDIQLFTAGVISAIYGLVMMAVLVGIMLQIKNDGVFAPSSVFFFLVGGEMIVTALLHPQELYCLPCGLVYYVTVPSMYLLLIIYSVFNLNVVSWGTRETAVKKTKEELEKEKKEAEEANKKAKQKSPLGFLQGGNNNDEEGSIEFSLAGLFTCMLCTHKKNGEEKIQLMRIAQSLESLGKRLDGIEKQLNPNAPRRRSTSVALRDNSLIKVTEEPNEEHESEDSNSDTMSTAPKEERDDLVNPYWIEDSYIRKGEVDYLSSTETQFWKDLLDTYLFPIEKNEEEEKKIAKELKDLRDKCVFAFFMMNALFVLIVFLLTLKKEFLHIKWPFGIKTNITYEETAQEVHIVKEYLQLEPIGLVFVFFFALILVIQFTAMLFHRFGTLSHILASTDLNFFCTKRAEDLSPTAMLDKDAVVIAKHLQKLRGLDDPDEDKDSTARPERRKTIHNLQKAAQPKREIGNLDMAFKRRYALINKNGLDLGSPILPKKINKKRESISALIAERRKSQMPINGGSAGSSSRNHAMQNAFDRGQINAAFVNDEDEINDRNSIQLQARNNWNNNNINSRM